jgi:hypothetical protein
MYLPQGETLIELRQHYTTPGRDLWHAVSNSVIEELKGLQATLEGMQDENRQPELITKLADKTTKLAGTLGMIGLGQAADITRLMAEDLEDKANRKEVQDLGELLQLSTHYVRLEKVLDEYARTGIDTTEAVFSSDAEGQAPDSARGLMRTTQAELTKAQARIVSFYKEGWAFYYLEDVITALDNISGALTIMDAQELLPLVNTALVYLREDLLARQREPSQQELAVFADILTLFEATVSARLNDEDYLALLPTGYEKLRELDSYSEVDLLEHTDLAAAEQDIEAKKKAKQVSVSALFQRLRNQQGLQTASLG